MNAQNLLQNPFAELSASFLMTGTDGNGRSSIRSRNDKSFMDFFQKEITKTQPTVKRDLAFSRMDNRSKESFHATRQLGSYKEISGEVKKTSSRKSTFNEIEARNDLSAKDSEDVVKSEKKAMADLLGLSESQLTALLDFLGLNFEKPLDSAQLDTLAEALSNFAGLTLQQSDVLKTALETIARNMDPVDEGTTTAFDGLEGQKAVEQTDRAIYIKHLEIALASENGKSAGLEEISQQVKMRILELTNEFTKNPDAFVEKLTQDLKPLLKEEPMQKETAQDETSLSEAGSSGRNAPDMSEENALKNVIDPGKENQDSRQLTKKESRSHQRTEGKFAEADNLKQYRSLEEKPLDGVISEEPRDDTLKLNGTDILQGNMLADSEIRTERTFTDVVLGSAAPLQEKDLLYQVIEKARVVLDGNKSEMIMDLKPDSLGKLTMKITTENGIVAAKLVAESQEVKQIIESNLNLLKDSLEKQGMNIQEFSVSVSDQNRDRYDGRKRFEKESGKRRVQRLTNSGVQVNPGMAEIDHRLAAYYPSVSTINLTA